MNCPFIACNHGVQSAMDAMSVIETPCCTQQTGGLTPGMTLRAIRTGNADRPANSAGTAAARAILTLRAIRYRAVLHGRAFRPNVT
jgi:hypothetical protein